MNLLGLTGKMGAGKDFTFTWLKERGYDVAREAFADQLRYEVEDIIGDGMHLPALWSKPYPDEVRALLQWWGTDLRRNQDPNYWLKALDAKLEAYEGSDTLIVVTDVRFPNEAKVIRDRGGLVASVWAPTKVRAERLGMTMEDLEERNRHPSERSMDRYPVDIILVSENGHVRPQQGEEEWCDLLARTPKR